MRSPVTPEDFDAVLFGLDGVLTTTATLQAAAWRSTFDTFLDEWDTTHGTTTARFEVADYAAYVDGKPRHDGVRDFLAARDITLPPGAPDDPPSTETVWGLGNLKQERVVAELATGLVEAFPGSIAWVRELREAGLKTAVVSSSQNCAAILAQVGISNLFDTRVDGQTALDQNLPRKPAPDMFLVAADLLGVEPARAVVVEDALAGVAAGRAGNFGLVIGVNRVGQAKELAEHGADLVVDDLGELLADVTEKVHRTGPRAHRLQAAARRILAASADHLTDPWRLVERDPNPDDVGRTESLFAVSNGYLGIRGAHEEGEPAYRPGTLLNGFHETWPIVYPEAAYGLATTGQTVVPVPDGTIIRVLVDEDPVSMATTEVRQYERTLNMAHGTLSRSVTYQLPAGLRIKIDSSRFVSLTHRHLACLRYDLTILHGPEGQAEPGAPTDLILSSELVTRPPVVTDPDADPRRTRSLAEDALRPDGERVDGVRVIRMYRTAGSGLAVAAAMDHSFDPAALTHLGTRVDQDRAYVAFAVRAAAGQTVTLMKWLAYHYGSVDSDALANRAAGTLDRAINAGYSSALEEHEREVAAFWAHSDVEWTGSQSAQQALRFSLFALLQGTARSEGHGVPSKGQTGTGYEGHYFWDTETYLLPFLIHTHPSVARSLLMHRINALPAARERARQVSCDGALFPWRTINGDEASPYYAAGTAQYHINADIAYALNQYIHLTGDVDLMYRHGAELLVETARMWASLGFFSDRLDGEFVIHGVTGPDEYSTVVDNNLFTNLMAAENLQTAADAVAALRSHDRDLYTRLVARTGLTPGEPELWLQAAEKMHIPYDARAGMHLQDDGFLDRKPWDFAATPAEKYPLLLSHHPLVIYRHQVIKQADVVLATVLLPERFTAEERRRIFEYYDALTTGDSSLSECIQAIAAADAGKYRTAEEYLVDALAVDLADTAGNLRDGLHLASAAGTWMAVVYGFGGYRWRTREFAPILPTRGAAHPVPPTARGVDARGDHRAGSGHLHRPQWRPGHRAAPGRGVRRGGRSAGHVPRRLPHPRRGAIERGSVGMTSDVNGARPRGAAAAVIDAPWSRPSAEVLAAVDSRPAGLTAEEVEQRLERFGPNRLAPPKPMPWWRRVLAQFDDTLIYILLVAAAFKAILADWVDFSVILGVAVINAIIGLVQEGRAERALDAIKNMLSVRAHVVRSGSLTDVDADGLVPGDIVRLRPGDRVPADVRLLESTGLQAEESALTGESVPAAKDVHEVPADAGLGDRHCMLHSGTLIAAGTGTGVVVATGQDTEIGKVQTMISQVEGVDTPLTRSLDALGKKLAVVILVMTLVMIVIGRGLHDFGVSDLVSAAIGFAIAAVPEGLPALVTITLALGVQQMARRRAITRKLPSVETLGAVTTICSDKTGTLTKNEMTARMVRTRGARFEVSGLGYAPMGQVTLGGDVVTVADRPDLARLVEDMAICNDATVVEDGSQWRLVGEPTEGALSVLGAKAGFATDGWRRVAVVPFDPATKYMGVLARAPDGALHVLVKGAPDRILERCIAQTGPTGDPEPLDLEFWESQIEEIGARGLRVLAAAHACPDAGTSTLSHADLDGGLELAGLVGIVDPPRPEAVDAIALCGTAGVRVKMITGDHAGTALAIGREMGIVTHEASLVLTGTELESMSTEALRATAREVDIYARTSPEHKLRIVAALQAHGEVVAMTGDGVNDAPALTRADVGVAMGIKGTEATKEAADIVLADDNFATIERAVEEGRRIYDNVRRSLLFLLPTNGAQSLVILIAVLFGLTLPLEPVQVLWINMVTSVTLGLALANERAEHDIMTRPPRQAQESIVPLSAVRRIALVAALIASATMGVFYYEHNRGVSLAESQTTAVTMLALGQLAYLFNCRFLDRSSLTLAVLRGNRAVWWAAAAMITLQLLFCYAPIAHTWFGTAPIGLGEWLLTAALAGVIFLLTEAAKAITRARTRTETTVRQAAGT